MKKRMHIKLSSHRTVKFILFQRSQYLLWRRNKTIQRFARALPRRLAFSLEALASNFNATVSLEALFTRKSVEKLFSEEMTLEYNQMKPYLPAHARTILDIGAGVGGIDILLGKHYEQDKPMIYLLDKTEMPAKVYYSLREKGCFYNSLELGRDMLVENGIKPEQIFLQEATDDNRIISDTKFDLIVSLISWGFHYPIATYLDQVYDKLAEGGAVITDVRRHGNGIELLQKKFPKTKIIFEAQKHVRIVAWK
ncbi:MAG: hypothetical protein HY617_01105 [Candidatus Sungbacteria bacterium]|nr:hypothetical protein [Candidatus Sungbacteria bacterium]